MLGPGVSEPALEFFKSRISVCYSLWVSWPQALLVFNVKHFGSSPLWCRSQGPECLMGGTSPFLLRRELPMVGHSVTVPGAERGVPYKIHVFASPTRLDVALLSSAVGELSSECRGLSPRDMSHMQLYIWCVCGGGEFRLLPHCHPELTSARYFRKQIIQS